MAKKLSGSVVEGSSFAPGGITVPAPDAGIPIPDVTGTLSTDPVLTNTTPIQNLQSGFIPNLGLDPLGKHDAGLTIGANQNLNRALSQGAGEQFLSFLNQAVIGEVIGGTIEGIGYLGEVGNTSKIINGQEQEWGNWLSQLGKDIRTWTQETTPIFQKAPGKFNPTDSGWWFGNGVSVASTLSLLIPAIGTVKGLGALGRGALQVLRLTTAEGAKLGRTASWIAEGISQAIISRHMENMMEGAGVFEETYQDRLSRGFSEVAARKSAAEAAGGTYSRDWAMLMQDIPQYMMLGRLKGPVKLTGKAGKEQAAIAAGLSDDAAAIAARGIESPANQAVSIGRRMANYAGEGFEEAYQHVAAQEARYMVDVKEGLIKPTKFNDRLAEYVKSGELQTAAFFGALGAGVFQTAGPPLARAADRIFKPEIVASRRDLEQAKVDEIQGRAGAISKTMEELLVAEQIDNPILKNATRINAATSVGLNAAVTGNTQNAVDHLQALQVDENTSDESKKVLPEIIADVQRIGELYEKHTKQYGKAAASFVQAKFLTEKMVNQAAELNGAANAEIQAVAHTSNLTGVEISALQHTLQVNSIDDAIAATKFILEQKDDISEVSRESNEERLTFLENQKKEIETEAKDFLTSVDIKPAERKKIATKINPIAESLAEQMKDLSAAYQLEGSIDDNVRYMNALTNKYGTKEAAAQRAKNTQALKDITSTILGSQILDTETNQLLDELEGEIVGDETLKQEAQNRIARGREHSDSNVAAIKKDNTGRLGRALARTENRQKILASGQFEQDQQDILRAIEATPTFAQVSPLQEVEYQDQRGYIIERGDNYVFIPKENPDAVIELEANSFDRLFDLDILLTERYSALDEIQVQENGNIIVDDIEYYNPFENPLQAILRNEDGDVMSVTLTNIRGEFGPRTFTNLSNELAYIIALQVNDEKHESQRIREEFERAADEAAARQESERTAEDGPTDEQIDQEIDVRIEAERKATAIADLNETEKQVETAATPENVDDTAAEAITNEVKKTEGISEGNPYERYELVPSAGTKYHGLVVSDPAKAVPVRLEAVSSPSEVPVEYEVRDNTRKITLESPMEGQEFYYTKDDTKFGIFFNIYDALTGQSVTISPGHATLREAKNAVEERLRDPKELTAIQDKINKQLEMYGPSPRYAATPDSVVPESLVGAPILDTTTTEQEQLQETLAQDLEQPAPLDTTTPEQERQQALFDNEGNLLEKEVPTQPETTQETPTKPPVNSGREIRTKSLRYITPGKIIVSVKGLPTKFGDIGDKIDWDLVHNPNTLNILNNPEKPAVFTLELSTNKWWEDSGIGLHENDPWVAQPIYVKLNTQRLGKIEEAEDNDTQWRKDIYDKLEAGETVEMEHVPYDEKDNSKFSKSAGSFNNMRLADGTPFFKPVNSLLGGYVRREDNTFLFDKKAPVHAALVVPVYTNKKLTGATLETKFLDPDVADDLEIINPPIDQIGQVYTIKMNHSGVYHALKASTANLTTAAIDETIKLLKAGNFKDAEHIVGSTSGRENLNVDDRMYYTAEKATKGAFFVFADPDGSFGGKNNTNTFLVDLEKFQKNPNKVTANYIVPLPNGNTAVVREHGQPLEVIIDAEDLLRRFLRRKKFNVKRELIANVRNTYTSPLNNETYDSYLDYLSAPKLTEGNSPSILSTDIFNDNGSFWHDVQIKMRPRTDQAKPYDKPEETRAKVTDDKPAKEDIAPLREGLREGRAYTRSAQVINTINIPATSSWLNQRGFSFEERKQVLETAERIGETEIHGYFNGLIYLWKNAEEGSQYHEAFHETFRTYLTEKERNNLYAAAKKRYAEPTVDDLTFLQEGLEEEHTQEELTELYYEEQMADEFKEWVRGQKPSKISKNPIVRYLQKLWNNIKTYFANRPLIDALFTQIESGAFASKPKVRSRNQEEYPANSRKRTAPELSRQIVSSINTKFITLTDPLRRQGKEYSVEREYRKVQIAFLHKTFVTDGGNAYLPAEKAAKFFDTYRKAEKENATDEELDAIQAKFEVEGVVRAKADHRNIYENWRTEFTQDGLDNEISQGWMNEAMNQLHAYGLRIKQKSAAETLEDELEDERIHGRSHFLDNIQDNMSGEIKQFLERIRQSDTQPTLLGEQPFYDRQTTFNHVTKVTTEATSMDDVITRMENSKDPVIKDIYVALQAKNSPQFKAAFYSALALTNASFTGTHEVITFDEEGNPHLRVIRFNANTAKAEKQILARWKDNAFATKGLFFLRNKIWNRNAKRVQKMARLVGEINKVKSKGAVATVPMAARKALIDYYELLGVDITRPELDLAMEQGIQIKGNLLTGARVFWYLAKPDSVNGSVGIAGIQDLLEAKKNPFNEGSGQRTLKNYTLFKAQFDGIDASSFLNGEGKSVFPINLPTPLARYVRMLQNYNPATTDARGRDKFWKDQVDLYMEDPSFNPVPNQVNADQFVSPLLHATRTSPIFRNTLEYHIYDAHIRKKEILARTTIKNISRPTDIMIRYNNLINNGSNTMLIPYPNLSDRQRMVYISMPRISLKDSGKGKMHSPVWGNKTIENILRGYVVQDLMRIRMVDKQLRANAEARKANKPLPFDEIENYHVSKDPENEKPRGLQFTQIDFLEGNPAAERLKKFVLSSSDDQITSLFDGDTNTVGKDMTEVMSTITAEFELRVQEELALLNELKINAPRGSQNHFDNRWTEKWITEQGKEDRGALVRDYIYATFIGQNELRKMTTGDLAFYTGSRNSAKRAGPVETPGTESMEVDMLPNNSYGDFVEYNTAIINDLFLNEQLQGYMKGVKIGEDIKKQYAQKTNITDAQGITTIHKHRAKMMGKGDWLPVHESAYRNYKKTGKFVTTDGHIDMGTGAPVRVLGEVIPPLTPLKTYHDGQYLVNGNTMTRIMDKHSTFPLLKEHTKNYPVLEELRQRMEAEGKYKGLEPIDELNTNTVRKVGAYGAVDLAMKNGVPANLDQLKIVKLQTVFQRIPQVIPENNRPGKFPSQLQKLILTNLSLNGLYAVGDEKIKGKDLKKLYEQGIEHLLDLQQEDLQQRLGWDPGVNYSTDNEARLKMLKKFRTLLQSTIIDRKLPSIYRQALNIKMDAAGLWNYEVPLAHPSLQRKFQQMGLGLWKNEALRLKFNSKSLVQMADMGPHAISGRLKFVEGEGDQLSVAEIAMSHTALKSLGISGEDLDAGKVPEDVRTLLAYRIPTAHKANGLVVKIVRTIPEGMGKAVLVPAEITAQMGSDFDVDKLFLMMPNYNIVDKATGGEKYNELGSFRKKLAKKGFTLLSDRELQLLLDNKFADYSGEIKHYRDRQTELESVVLKAKEQIGIERERLGVKNVAQKVKYKTDEQTLADVNVTDLNTRQAENLVLDMMTAIMRSQKHTQEILTPIGYDTLKGQRDRMGIQQELSPTEVDTERQLELENKAGSAGIGISANQQTGYAIGTQSKTLRTAPIYAIRIDGQVLTALNVNKTKSGKILDFAFSERINAATDNANDPVMYALNDNSVTSPVIGLLLRTGAENKSIKDKKKENNKWEADPNNFTTMVVNQPIIRELAKRYMDQEKGPEDMMQVAKEVATDMLGLPVDDFLESETVEMTTEELIEGINHVIDNKNVQDIETIKIDEASLAHSQMRILSNFLHWHKAGRVLNKANRVFNADRIKSMSTMADIEAFNDLDNSIRDPERNQQILGIESILSGEDYAPTSKYLSIINTAQQFGDLFFPYNGGNFESTKRALRTQLGREELSADVIDYFNIEAFTWLAGARHFPFDGVFDEATRDFYMKGDNSIDKQLMREKEKHPDNRFLQPLTPSESNYEDGVELMGIDFKYHFNLTTYEQDAITDGFRDLMESADGDTRDFARNLVWYMIMSKGFRPGRGNYSDLLPLEVWNDPNMGKTGESLSSVIEIMLNKYDDANTIGEEFLQDFIYNNFRRIGVRRIKKKAPKNLAPIYASPTGDPKYIQLFSREKKEWVLYEKLAVNPFATIEEMSTDNRVKYIYVDTQGVAGKWKNYQNIGTKKNNVKEQREGSDAFALSSLSEIVTDLEGRFGVEAQIIEDSSERYAGKFENGLPVINLTYAKGDTPFHEFGHPFIAAIREDNPELWGNLITQIVEETEIVARTERLYPELKGMDLYEEAIMQSVGELAADARLKRDTRTLLEQFLDWVRSFFSNQYNKTITAVELSADTTLQELGIELGIGAAKIAGKFDTNIRFSKLTDQDVKQAAVINDWKQFYNAIVKVLVQRKIIFEKRGLQVTSDKFKELKAAFKPGISEAEQKQAVVHFIEEADIKVTQAMNRLGSLVNSHVAGEEVTEEQRLTMRKLADALDYVSAFGILSHGLHLLRDTKLKDTTAAEVVGNINGKITRVQADYEQFTRSFAAQFLDQYNDDPNLSLADIEQMLQVTSEDISYRTRWLGSLASSPDQILQLTTKAVKAEQGKVQNEVFNFGLSTLGPVENKLIKEAGTTQFDKLYDFMLQKDDEGELTGHYIAPAVAKRKNLWDKMTATQQAYLEIFHEEYQKAQRLLRRPMRQGTLLPTILKPGVEQRRENVKEAKSLGQQLKKGWKKATTITIDTEDTIEAFEVDAATQKVVRFLPVRFAGTMEALIEQGFNPRDLSFDMSSNLLRFMTMAKNHDAMSKILIELEAVEELVRTRTGIQKIGQKFAQSKIVKQKLKDQIAPATTTGSSQAFDMLRDYMNMHVFGQKKDVEFIPGTNISLTKTADLLGKYTSLSQLAFNLYSGVNNSTIGNVMNILEAMGGQFYSLKEWRSSGKDYIANMPGFISDAYERFPKNKVNQWLHAHDIFQEYDENGLPLKQPNPLHQMGMHTLFFIQSATEHQIQSQLSIAMTKSHRIVGKDIMNYNDYIVAKNKKKNKETKAEFEKNATVWSHIEKGDTNGGVTQEVMGKFAGRIKGVYRRLHGNYSKKDIVAANRFAIFRLALMFRKWFNEGVDRRFRNEEFDGHTAFNQEMGVNIAGNYRIAFNFLQRLKKEYNGYMMGIISFQKSEAWKDMAEWQKQGVYRTMGEIGFFVGTLLLIGLVNALGGDDDDEKSWAENFGLYQAYRLKAEIAFYVHPGEAMKILRSPMASLSSLERIGNVLYQAFPESYIPPEWERYEAGERKGRLKFVGKAEQAMPVWSQMRRVMNPGEHVGYMKR